jgi:MFS superfamily sulfate permease-like transporter
VRQVSLLLTRPVSLGIIMGLGLSLGLDGIRMMSSDWLLAGIALAVTFVLLANRAIPVMFLLLLLGAFTSAIKTPELFQLAAAIQPAFGLPQWTLAQIGWNDLAIGALVLALPQLPLTLGNAIVGITEENNRLFPDRRTTESRVALSTGVMNLLAPQIGGVPMCHGAGGMAGHVAFGARTGGATIILGAVLILLAVFFGGSVATLLKVLSPAVLGVILFVTGIQLALGGTCDFRKISKPERFIHMATAALAMWNIGIAFLVGLALQELHRRKRLHV